MIFRLWIMPSYSMSVMHGLLSVGQSPRFCWGWAKDTRWIIPCLDSGRLFLLKSSFFRMLEWEPVVKTVLLSSKFWKPAPAHWYQEWNKVWGEVDQKVGASIRRWREHLVESRFCHQHHRWVVVKMSCQQKNCYRQVDSCWKTNCRRRPKGIESLTPGELMILI